MKESVQYSDAKKKGPTVGGGKKMASNFIGRTRTGMDRRGHEFLKGARSLVSENGCKAGNGGTGRGGKILNRGPHFENQASRWKKSTFECRKEALQLQAHQGTSSMRAWRVVMEHRRAKYFFLPLRGTS